MFTRKIHLKLYTILASIIIVIIALAYSVIQIVQSFSADTSWSFLNSLNTLELLSTGADIISVGSWVILGCLMLIILMSMTNNKPSKNIMQKTKKIKISTNI